MKDKVCETAAAPKLIFSCSGAADVGEIADRAARKMTREGAGMMFCLAGVGGRVEGIMKTTGTAAKILALDGCGLDCVKKTLEEAGFKDYIHLRVTDLGLEKGQSPVNDERIAQTVQKAAELINA